MRRGYVYMLTNQGRTTLYTGVASNLVQRMQQHRSCEGSAFTAQYKTHNLVYVQVFEDIRDAIAFEKKIKAGSRSKKDELIVSVNPKWRDLMDEIDGL